MIPQLIERMTSQMTKEAAGAVLLTADPLDLLLHMEQLWDFAAAPAIPSPARRALWQTGRFNGFAPKEMPAWEHLAYSYVLENSRAVQILRRVVREYRSGEGLGIPSVDTQQWLDVTETLLFGAANPIAAWLSTSSIRQDPEAVRRNAYWRFFGMDLAFGTDDNKPPVYDKATAANAGFVRLFEELLFELWQAMSNERNLVGANSADDDRIFRIAEELGSMLRSRRQRGMLLREELSAATVLGWIELTLSIDTPVVLDLRAQATSPGDRLRLIGERVGLPAHGKSAALFSMAPEISMFLRTIESGVVKGPQTAWLLYLTTRPATDTSGLIPIGADSRRVITEWAAATGKDLKVRGKPIETSRPRLAAVQ
jgi:hypothetical protein